MWTINNIYIGKINETWNNTMEQASKKLDHANVKVSKQEIKSLSKAELEQLCRILDLGDWFNLNKSELVKILVEYYA